jgi:hypothetical protein
VYDCNLTFVCVQAALKLVLDKIAELEANFKAANDEKESLANQV